MSCALVIRVLIALSDKEASQVLAVLSFTSCAVIYTGSFTNILAIGLF
jgi:hypothetical protein